MLLPSFDALTNAFLSPAITALVSTPDVSHCPKNVAASAADIPNSFRAAAFDTIDDANVSIEIPVSCPTLFIVSRSAPASSALKLNASITFCVLSMDELTSVPFSSANLINFADRFSSSSPVKWNRVFTSPTAVPAVSKSVGIVFAIFLAEFCISSSASPVAPVFWTMISIPSSTCAHAAMTPAPAAVIGAVTFFVKEFPIFPVLSLKSFTFFE